MILLYGRLKRSKEWFYGKHRFNNWWTPKEQQQMKLYMFEFYRKIGESKERINSIGSDLEKYKQRKFEPIFTKKFEDMVDY